MTQRYLVCGECARGKKIVGSTVVPVADRGRGTGMMACDNCRRLFWVLYTIHGLTSETNAVNFNA